jgi:anti-sigma regulatory factor (Ser/Thr protein kinase)
MAARLTITRLALLGHLRELRGFVESAAAGAGVDPETVASLALAADEVLSNVIEHGYPEDRPGPITITVEIAPGAARLEIADRGRPFPPEAAPPPDLESGWRSRPIGGLGWHLIRSLVDRIEYDTDSECGNRLTLFKSLPAS